MADFEKNLSLEDALTDNPPEVEEEIKRDFISTLEAEPYDDVIGETCGKCDYIPLLDDDAEKSGNHEHQNKPKIDGNHVERAAASQPAVLENGDRGIEENFMIESARVSMDEEKMYSEFRTQKEPWQLEPEHCFEPQPVFQPVQQSVPFESNKNHDLLSELLLLPSSETKSRPAFTEHFGASGDLPASTNNEAFRDDWLGDGQVRAEKAEDLEYFAKKEGSPGEVLHEHSPWEAASFPVETAKDDHTASHWQPTIQEQQVLGMRHPSEPGQTAEFALLEDSAAAVTLAELAGEIEFSDWQHTNTRVPLDSSETLDKNGNIPSAPTFDEAGVPETNVAGDKEFFPKHDLPKESRPESMEIDQATALVAVEMAEDEILLQHISKPQQELQEDAMELEKHKESEPEALTFGEEAVNEIADEEPLPQLNSHKESVPGVLTFDARTVSLGMEYESSAQRSSSILEGLGLDAATPSFGLEEESSQYQNDVNDGVFEVIVRNEPLPCQNLELHQQYKGPADDVEQTRTIPGVLPLDTTTLHVDSAIPEKKISSQLESETHQEQSTAESLAPALTHDQQELLSEAPSTNAFNIPSSMELQEASPYLRPQLDPPVAPAEARAPADGACTVEEEKQTAAPCPFLHSEPGTLLQSADGILDELKASVPEAPAPATVSVLEDHKSESSDQHTEEPVLETSASLKQVSIPNEQGYDQAKPVAVPVANIPDKHPADLWQPKPIDSPLAPEPRSNTRTASRTKALHKKAAELMDTKREAAHDEWTPEGAPAMIKKKKKKPKQKKTLQAKAAEVFPGNDAGTEISYITPSAAEMLKSDIQSDQPIENLEGRMSLRGYAVKETTKVIGQTSPGADSVSVSGKQHNCNPVPQIMQTNEVLLAAPSSREAEQFVKGEQIEDSLLSQSQSKLNLLPMNLLENRAAMTKIEDPKIQTTPKGAGLKNKSKKHSELKAIFLEGKSKELGTHLDCKTNVASFLDSNVQREDTAHFGNKTLEEKKRTQPPAEESKNVEVLLVKQPSLLENQSDVAVFPVVLTKDNLTETSIGHESKKVKSSYPDFNTEYEKDNSRVQGCVGPQQSSKLKKSRNCDRRKKVEHLSLDGQNVFESKIAGGKGQASSVMPFNENYKASECADKSGLLQNISSDHLQTKKEQNLLSCGELVEIQEKVQSAVSLNSKTDVGCFEAKHREFYILSSKPNVPVDIKTDLDQVEVFVGPVEGKEDMVQAKPLFEPTMPFQSVESERIMLLSSELDLCPEIKDVAVHTQALSEATPTLENKIDMVNINIYPFPDSNSVQVSSEYKVTAEGTVALQASSESAVHDESKANKMEAVLSKLPVSSKGKSAMTPGPVYSEHPLCVESKKDTAPVSSEPVATIESKGDLTLVSSVSLGSKESTTDSTDLQVGGASSVSSTEGTVKEPSLIGNKKSGRGSLKRSRNGDSKGAKTSIVAQGEEITKDNSLPHKSREGMVTPSKHSLSLGAKANVHVCTSMPLLQDTSSAVSLFDHESEEYTDILNLKEEATSLPSVLEVQDVCKAGVLDEIKEMPCTFIQLAASLDIEADFSDISSTNNRAKNKSHVEKTRKGGPMASLPLKIVESTEHPGKDPIIALTKDKTKGKGIKEDEMVKFLHSETAVGYNSEADGPGDLSELENKDKTLFSDKIKPCEISFLERSAYLECPAAVELYPNVAQLDEQVNISLLEAGVIDSLEITGFTASPVIIDSKTKSSVSLDVSAALLSSSKSHSISDVSLAEPPVLALKDKAGQPFVSLEVEDVKNPAFEAFLSCDGNTDSAEVPRISFPAEGRQESPVVDKVSASDCEQKTVTPEDAASKTEVSPKDEISMEDAHFKSGLEKPVKSGQAEAKKAMKTDLTVRGPESMKGYMRPTKSRGLLSPQPRSSVHDAMNTNQTRDRSTSQRRPKKVNLEASSAAEAIAGSISAPPSKELPPSPEKKGKASAAAASAKPATAKGRPASTTSPKQSTPPPCKKASSPAPVASSTPKRPASSSARPSNLTPKDSTTPRSATLTPKEMKPKGLDLKSPIKSPEKKTPVSKASTTVTPRAAVKPATGTPKAAMVPAVAVASTTPRRPTTIKADAKPVEAKKATTTAKSADLSRPKTAPVNTGKSNATTPSSPGTNSGPAAPINRPKPAKSVMTKPILESNATTDGKKVPSAKAPASKVNVAPKTARPGSVPAPDLKNVRSKIGSTDNLKYQPGGGKAKVEKRPESAGATRKPAAPFPVTRTATTKTTVSKETAQKDTNGRVAKSAPIKKVQPVNAPKCRPGSANVQILNKKVDTSKVAAKCGSKVNIKHKPGGGDVKIENHKSNVKDKVQSKVGSLDNMGHAPAGGKVKSEGSENAGDMAQTPQNGDLSTPQGLAGSEMQQNDVPAEGIDQRETQNFDNQIQETN